MIKINRVWLKLSIAFVLMVIVIMALVTYTFTIRQITAERKELNDNMGSIARMIASVRFVESEGWYVYQDWIDNLIESEVSAQIVYIAIFDENQNLAARTLNYSLLDLGSSTYLTASEQDEIVERLVRGHVAQESQQDFDHILVDIREGSQYLGHVDVGFSLVEFNVQVLNRLFTNLGYFILFLISGILGSIFLGKKITKPLTVMSKAMRLVSAGQLDQQLDIENTDEIGDLARSFNYMTVRLQERQIIESFARKLAFTVNFEKLQKLIIDDISQAMKAQKGAILLKQEGPSAQFFTTVCKYPQQNSKSVSLKTEAVMSNILDNQKGPITKRHFADSEELLLLRINLQKELEFENIELLIPIKSNTEIIGFILLSEKTDSSAYDINEQQFLATLTNQATFAIEHAFVLQELTAKQHLEKELEIARIVQKRLLPENEPFIKGAQISGVCLPAFEIGGDYFDYFVLDENRTGIAIADVSGKGTSAAFYMAEIKGMMTSLAHVVNSPKKLLEIVNRRLYQNVDRKVFATMIYGIWDSSTNEFNFVRAGHNALIVKKAASDVEFLIPQGIGLGLANDDMFKKFSDEIKLSLSSGDTIVLYTDGISEAMNNKKEEFGEDRLCDVLSTLNGHTPKEMQTSILNHVKNFTQNAPQHDDITMVLLKVE
jgi:serine phosphatase RsbU (regulator of sigma subunit)/HAMP domain-containing protein